MTIGDRVRVWRTLLKKRKLIDAINHRVEWVDGPALDQDCVYLGTTTVYNGSTRIDDDEGGYSRYFVKSDHFVVAVIQPIDGSRYRKPVYATPDDVYLVADIGL